MGDVNTLVDVGQDPAILASIERAPTGVGKWPVEQVVLTHSHSDHCALLPQIRDIRRMGSAALDLAWTAAGRYDAFYERGVQRWDVAAGLLLCAEAGLEHRELEARGALPAGVLVAPAGIVDALYAIVG